MPQKEFADKFVLICEETEICKRLSSNDVKVRKKGVSALKHLLKTIDSREVVDSTDFSRLWNGIFHFIWMSDKLLVQEEDVESISNLIHVLKKHEMLFVRGFFESLTSQWNRISHYRTDKFLMMVRRFLRQILFLLKNAAWNFEKIELFSRELYSAIQILPLGLVLHLNDIYIEEIAKVCEGSISTDALILLLKGYVDCIVDMKPSMNVVNHINSNIFSGLTRQLKLHIRQNAVLSAEENEEVEEATNSDQIADVLPSEKRAFDPRPGNVDVYLPFIEFDENKMVEFLQTYQRRPAVPAKVKNILSQIIDMFKSITKLRESICNPKKISSESYNNTNKRKKRHKSFGALVKKSCKRLEMLEAESDNFAAEDRILKKLEKMNDLIQIPVGKKLVTVEKKNLVVPKSEKKLKRRSNRVADQTWTVTDCATECESVTSSDKRSDQWTVFESQIELDSASMQADDSQNLELELTGPAIEKSSPSSPVAGKRRRSAEIKLETSSPPTKSPSHIISDVGKLKRRKIASTKDELQTVQIDSIEQVLRSPPQKVPESPKESLKLAVIENGSEKASEGKSSPSFQKSLSPKKSPKVVQSENSDGSVPQTNLSLKKSSVTVVESEDEVQTRPSCSISSPKKSVEGHENVSRSESAPVKRCKALASRRCKAVENEATPSAAAPPECASPSVRRTRSRVSSSLDDEISTRSPRRMSRRSSTLLPDVVVPILETETPPKLSKIDEDETDADSKSPSAKSAILRANDGNVAPESGTKRQILTSNSPAWIAVPKNELAFWIPKEAKEQGSEDVDGEDGGGEVIVDDDDVDYDVSSLFASPPQQQQKRRRSVRPLVQEVKRSARLANKAAAAKLCDDKKVVFTHNNSFQG